MKLLIDSLGSRPLNATLVTFLVVMIIVLIITISALQLTNSCEDAILDLIHNPWYKSFSSFSRNNNDGSYYQSSLFAFHTAFTSMMFSFHPDGEANVKSMRECFLFELVSLNDDIVDAILSSCLLSMSA